MHTALRILILVCVGIVLAQLSTWVIGWFAAFAWDPATYKSVARNPVTAFLVLTVAAAALPVALLSAFTGRLLAPMAQRPRWPTVLVLSLPWALALLQPHPGMGDPSGWYVQLLQSAHAVTVFFALPIGLAAGLAFGPHPARG